MLRNPLVSAGDINFMPWWDMESRWEAVAILGHGGISSGKNRCGDTWAYSDRVTRMANISPLALWVSNMGHSFASMGFSWHRWVCTWQLWWPCFDSPGGFLTIPSRGISPLAGPVLSMTLRLIPGSST